LEVALQIIQKIDEGIGMRERKGQSTG
jgi:hypothetical protein